MSTDQQLVTEQMEQHLQQWMCTQLPAAEGLELSNFKTPEVGASNETVLFTANWQEGAEKHSQLYVLRLEFQAKFSGDGLFSSYDLGLQYRTMACLQGSGVLVPELLAYEDDATILGKPFFVMLGLSGEAVGEQPPYHMDGWFTELNDAQRGAMWRNAMLTIAGINKLDWRALGFEFLLPSDGRSCLQMMLDDYRDYLQWTEAKGQAYPALWAMHSYLVANQPPQDTLALCWGDAKLGNLLFGPNGEVTGVLDWEMVHLGNPLSDLSWWMTLDNSMSEGLKDLLGMEVPKQSGLLSKDEMIALWQVETGFSTEHFDYYELLSAFKFGVIMTNVGLNLTRDGIMPPEMTMDVNHTCTPLMNRLMNKHGISAD